MSPLLIFTSLVHIMTKNKMCTAPCACSALNACTALQTRSLLMLWLLSCCRCGRRRVTDPSFCYALHKIITKKLEKSKRLVVSVVSAVDFLRIRESLWPLVIRLVEREAMSSRKRSRGARATASENGRSLRQKASSKSVYVDGLSGKDYTQSSTLVLNSRRAELTNFFYLNSREFLNFPHENQSIFA